MDKNHLPESGEEQHEPVSTQEIESGILPLITDAHMADIPPVFYCYNLNAPFTHCTVCDKDLLNDNTQYVIEKAYHKTEIIFEIAMCMSCSERMQKTLSEESMITISRYFEEKTDLNARQKELFSEKGNDLEDWLGHCLISSTPQSEMSHYQIYGFFMNDKIIYYQFPYMLGSAALHEISGLLSKQTRDELNGFMDRHLGPSPEFEELLRPPVLVL